MRKITGECKYNGDCEYRTPDENQEQASSCKSDLLLRKRARKMRVNTMSFPDLELLPTKEDIVKKDMEIERLENKVNQMRDAIETALSYQGESMEEWLYEKLKFCL